MSQESQARKTSGRNLFVRPPRNAFDHVQTREYLGYATYSQYNYLRPGLVPYLKTRRFEKALQIAKPWIDSPKPVSVIDFGCADGVFLPSLSRHFADVAAVDTHDKFIEQARGLAQTLELSNVTFLCNEGLSMQQVADALPHRNYSLIFLLETLEHVGERERMYESKVDFVRELFTLVKDDGAIITSVPCMTGMRFFAKYMTQTTLRLHREKFTVPQLLKASFLCQTDELEPLWTHGHIGFNERKLTRSLCAAWPRTKVWNTLTSVFYLIQR